MQPKVKFAVAVGVILALGCIIGLSVHFGLKAQKEAADEEKATETKLGHIQGNLKELQKQLEITKKDMSTHSTSHARLRKKLDRLKETGVEEGTQRYQKAIRELAELDKAIELGKSLMGELDTKISWVMKEESKMRSIPPSQ